MLYDQHVSLLLLDADVLDIRVQFTDYLCCILVIFGVIGNILGLCIFSSSRRTWRISSVYVYLATCTSIVNLFCVIRYALLLHSKSQNILRELVGRVFLACKIYEFSFAFRVISSWITLFWMFERLTCISRRLRTLFHRWNASRFKFVFPIIILILILIGVLGPPLLMYRPQISRNKPMNCSINPLKDYCGLNSDVSLQWQNYFHRIHFGLNHYTIRCLFSELIPAVGIILFNSCIMYHLLQTSDRLSEKKNEKKFQERKRVTSWMNVVLILHSLLFFLSLLSHIVGHFLSVEAHETWWVLLAVLGNCSLNFYLYCLSGRAFRQQIRFFIQQITTRNFDRLRQRKEQWQQRRFKKEMDQLTVYRQKTDQKPIGINSLSELSDEESPI